MINSYNFYPYADILERMLFNIIDSYQPTVRWWYFPRTYDGAFIMTHDEESFGDKSTYMSDYEESIGATSTFFMISDEITKNAIGRMLSQGIDVQLHWDRTRRNPNLFNYIGFWRIRPFKRPYGLKEQMRQLQSKISDGHISENRNHFLVWEGDYTQTFRILYAHNFLLDSTYGPDTPFYGYLFGTGMPFYPIDKNGLIIPVVEVPFLDMDGLRIENGKRSFDGQPMKKLIVDSKNLFHETLVFIFHTIGMACYPSVPYFLAWLNIYDYAREHNHWITNFKEYLSFHNSRIQSSISSKYESNVLTVLFNAENDSLSLVIPTSTRGKKFSGVRLDGGVLSPQGCRKMNSTWILVRVPKGSHRLQVDYH